MPKPNERIGPYQLISKLGKGAFGEVWLARNVSALAAREVALKIPLDEDVDLDAIRQEAAIWIAASGHTNVLPIIEANLYDGQVVIASEYAPDGSLEQWLKRHGGRAPSVEAALEMARGILAGLEYLHARKIIHRDLKPANILLQGKTPRIADFGISRVLKSASLSAVMAGTPVYMAPEAFRCKRNEQTDLWSAGVILYQLLSGRLPFAGHDPAEVMWAITDEEAAPLPASMPDWVRQAVATVLAKDPAARFKTAEQMGAALVEPRIAPLPKPQPAPSASTVLVDPTTIVRPVDRKPTPVSPEKMVWAPHFTENLNGVPLEMILVPGGKFKMGSPAGEEYDNTKPQHDVIVPAFYVGKFPVTQAQWQAVMGSNPSYFKGNDRPVEGVSWYDVKEFCQKLSQLSDKPYRLPSEAEWEYACRGGTTGDDAGDIYEMAWYGENSSFKTHPVGQKKPNSFGLYDMHGNVWEWCEDVWHKNYLGAPTDGSAWLSGGDFRVRVIRGGSWGSSEEYCRAAPRHYLHRGNCDQYRGLRVVMSARTQ